MSKKKPAPKETTQRTTKPAADGADREWLREFAASAHDWQLQHLRRFAERTVCSIDIDDVRDFTQPFAHQIAWQRRMLADARRYLGLFNSTMHGLAETGPSVRWVDGIAAIRLVELAELLTEELNDFNNTFDAAAAVDELRGYEMAMTAAVAPRPEALPGTIPETLTNVMAFVLELSALESRVWDFRGAGGHGDDVAVNNLTRTCEEVRNTLLSAYINRRDVTDDDVRLTRMLAGVAGPVEG